MADDGHAFAHRAGIGLIAQRFDETRCALQTQVFGIAAYQRLGAGAVVCVLILCLRHRAALSVVGRWVEQQARNGYATLQVRVHDFVDIAFIHIGVPSALGVNHRDGARFAAPQATRTVDANLAIGVKTREFDPRFAVFHDLQRAMVLATDLAIVTRVGAKENVFVEVLRHTPIIARATGARRWPAPLALGLRRLNQAAGGYRLGSEQLRARQHIVQKLLAR